VREKQKQKLPNKCGRKKNQKPHPLRAAKDGPPAKKVPTNLRVRHPPSDEK